MADQNLARIPEDWHLIYGAGKQIIFLDSDVVRTAGNPSIRLEAHTLADVNTSREVDGTWYLVKEGDHIILKCWMKTTPSALGDTNPYSGARINFDFYTEQHYDATHNGQLHSTEWWLEYWKRHPETDNYVHWNTPNWVQRVHDFTIPKQASGFDGKMYPVNQIVPTLQVWSSTYYGADTGKGWFADAELYINPTSGTAELPPPAKPSAAARTIGPFGIPSAVLHQLWVLRERYISKEVHKKLHPLV